MTYSYATARRAPLLEWDDERVLIEDWQRNRDKGALEALLLSHARVAHFWARRLTSDAAEQEELVAEGIIGMIRAADMFDPAREVRFSTYARWWVRNAVMLAFRRMRNIVDVPGHQRAELSSQSLDEADVHDAVVCDDPTPEEHLIAKSARDMLRDRVSEALAELDAIDREVLTCRSLKQPPDTLGDLATRLGLNTSKLRQVERRAMHRLKNVLISRGVMTGAI